MLLHIIICSTRPGRAGLPIAKWFFDYAAKDAQFECKLVDLAEVNLPLLDEPAHPRMQQYQHEHTKRWSALVNQADAYVFVTPEYNYGAPPALVNALNYVYNEWNYKPCGFVSYGGLSGGTRSVQMAKGIVTTLKMVPLPEAVNFPFFSKLMNDEGVFIGNDLGEKAAADMLTELVRWAEALKPMRMPR